MTKHLSIILFCILTTFILNSCGSSREVTLTQKKLEKDWEVINKRWVVKDGILRGDGMPSRWGIIVCKEKLPDDYIIEFSSDLKTDERLFEILIGYQDNKFVGVLMNYLNKTIELEDRTLSYINGVPDIRTKENIGALPEVSDIRKDGWSKWTIQKAGNKLFVWIDGEEVIALDGKIDILKNGGQIGFATSGQILIKDFKVSKSKNGVPQNFKGRAEKQNFFLFGE